MRLITLVIAVVVGTLAPARAQIARKPPSLQVQAQLSQLEKELLAQQAKQAPFAAVKTAKTLYELRKKQLGADAPDTQRTATTYATLLTSTGDYATAVSVYKEQLAVIEQKHGPSSNEVHYALSAMTGPLWAQSNYAELELVYQRQLAIAKQLHGMHSRDYATALNMYALLLNARNEYTAALTLYEQAFAITEAMAKDDSALASGLQTLGATYWATNQHKKAIATFDRLLVIANEITRTNVMHGAALIWGVAAVYHYGGRKDLAAPLHDQVIALYQKEVARLEKRTPMDPLLPGLLGQLGFAYRQTGDLARAEQWITKANTVGTHGQWTASLAEIKRALGKPADALVLLEQAKADLQRMAPQVAHSYDSTIADVLREMGDTRRAQVMIDAHLAQLAKQVGTSHPSYGYALLSAARIYTAAKDIPRAEATLMQSMELAERELQNALKSGTEADHAVYFSRNVYLLDAVVNFELRYAATRPSVTRLALTTLLRRKGRVLDAAAASLATIRAKLSPDDKRLLDDLANARAQLAKLTVAGPAATGDTSYAQEIAALEAQIARLEISVGKKSAAYRVTTQPVSLAAVQKAIPRKAKLVEIVNYQPFDTLAPYAVSPVLAPRRYAAYVVGGSGDPVLVELGEAQVIDAAIEKFRKAVANPKDTQVTVLGRALYDLTVAKLVPALGGATEIVIAPDGALNVVPFSALVDAAGEFLVKNYNFTYLTSGRDLLRLSLRTKAQGGGVMFADPAFDATTTAPAGSTRGSRSGDLASLLWPPLPGTAKEADEVEKQIKLVVFRKDKATEGALKQVRGPRVLHLATHGFFLPDEPVAAADTARGASPSHENPLLRSGLALAGANSLVSGNDDGILTAMEASGLDLWGTKLVVLSACETGVGKVTNGDGVYGLRRALVIAGAESMVMSLWQVDDEATKELMIGYYARLQKQRPRSSALRETQLELASRPNFAHPFYWASFVPAGANEPLGK